MSKENNNNEKEVNDNVDCEKEDINEDTEKKENSTLPTKPIEQCCNYKNMYFFVSKKLEQVVYQNQILEKSLKEFKETFDKNIKTQKTQTTTQLINSMLNVIDIVDSINMMIESPEKSELINIVDLSVINAIKIINTQVRSLINKFDVELIAPAEGEELDPNYHMVISTVQSNSEKKPNSIIKILRNGYKIQNKLIRPAAVVVAV